MNIYNVIETGVVQELKTGYWKKQLNQMDDSEFEVEVYWVPYIYEAPRPDHWARTFSTEESRKAEALLSKIRSMTWVRRNMTKIS